MYSILRVKHLDIRKYDGKGSTIGRGSAVSYFQEEPETNKIIRLVVVFTLKLISV